MERTESEYFRSQLVDNTLIDKPKLHRTVRDRMSQTNATLRIAAFSGISALLMNELITGSSSFRDSLLTGIGSLTVLSSAYYLDLSREMQKDRDNYLGATYDTISEEGEKRLNPNSRKTNILELKSILLAQYIFQKNTVSIDDDRPEESVMEIEDLCFELVKKYNIASGQAFDNTQINRVDFAKYVYRLIESHSDNARNLSKKEKIALIDKIRSIGLDYQITKRNINNTEDHFHEDYLISKILNSANPNIFQFGKRIYQLDQETLTEVLEIGFLTGFNINSRKGTFPIFNQHISFILKDYARYAYYYDRKMFNSASNTSYESAITKEDHIRRTWIKEKFQKNLGVGLLSTLTALSITKSDFIEQVIHTLTHI